jgi:hypothetical protein
LASYATAYYDSSRGEGIPYCGGLRLPVDGWSQGSTTDSAGGQPSLTEALASVPVDGLHATYVSVPLSAVAAVAVLAAGLLAPDADFQPVVALLAFVARAFARGSNWMMALFMATSLNLP